VLAFFSPSRRFWKALFHFHPSSTFSGPLVAFFFTTGRGNLPQEVGLRPMTGVVCFLVASVNFLLVFYFGLEAHPLSLVERSVSLRFLGVRLVGRFFSFA